MKLTQLHIDGFGQLVDRTIDFAPGLTIVYGENEAGKSTLARAIVASLYGVGRKEDRDAWRPWSGARYATILRYQLATGEALEVQREFERDPKGVRVYDRSGNDISARVSVGKTVAPGEAALRIPLEVFLNAACVQQQGVAIDGTRAKSITTALAHALDGGPKDDAALGALGRLDAALKAHVGTERATKNNPLRAATDRATELGRRADEARARIGALADLRARYEAAEHEHRRLEHARVVFERRRAAYRARAIRTRLENLARVRAELASLNADRARFEDVATFDVARLSDLDAAFYAASNAAELLEHAEAEDRERRMRSEEHHELDARRADVGTIEDIAFEALVAAAAEADAARARSAAAQTNAAHARRTAGGGATMLGAGVAAGLTTLAVAVGFAIAHSWIFAGIAAIVAGASLLVVGLHANGRSQSGRDAARLQQSADAALAEERAAASAVAAVLEPLGLASIDDLTRRRDRLRELEALARSENRANDHLIAMRTRQADATRTFDLLAAAIVPDATGSREQLRDEAKVRASRRYERDGLDAARGMIELRRGEVLGGEDEFALERELNELLAEGVEPAAGEIEFSPRLFDEERAEIEARLRATEASVAALGAERRAAEEHAADIAELDEEHALARAEIAKIETFARAIALARTTLEARTREAHEKFARRLEDYAAEQFTTITGGRYTDLFVDPTTLDVRVRVPETRAIVGLETLSAGTREQAFLVVRFAMARMFSEGLETPPLLLDDPFAFWDAARVERCLPILLSGAQTMQAIVFTASAQLADAARSAGAAIETLHRNADGDFVDALDRDENLLFPR